VTHTPAARSLILFSCSVFACDASRETPPGNDGGLSATSIAKSGTSNTNQPNGSGGGSAAPGLSNTPSAASLSSGASTTAGPSTTSSPSQTTLVAGDAAVDGDASVSAPDGGGSGTDPDSGLLNAPTSSSVALTTGSALSGAGLSSSTAVLSNSAAPSVSVAASTVNPSLTSTQPVPSASASIGAPNPCGTSCGATEGCLSLRVDRVPVGADNLLAWNRGFTSSIPDGVGRLVASASSGNSLRGQRFLEDADLRPEDANYFINIGCIAPGSYRVWVYLEDHPQPAEPGTLPFRGGYFYNTCTAYSSSISSRIYATAEVVGGASTTVSLTLAQSCDS
jgi:hypothetical protein